MLLHQVSGVGRLHTPETVVHTQKNMMVLVSVSGPINWVDILIDWKTKYFHIKS
jgi:hypothetical protein